MSNDKLKVFIHEEDNSWNPENLDVIYCSMDAKVVFEEPEFEHVTDWRSADIIPVLLKGSTVIQEYIDSNDLITFLSRFRGKTVIDYSHCQHIGEGHSGIDKTCRNALLILKVIESMPEQDRPNFLTLTTNWAWKSHRIPDSFLPKQKFIQYTDFLWNRNIIFFKEQPDRIFKYPGSRNAWYQPFDDELGGMPKYPFTLDNLSDIYNNGWMSTKQRRELDTVPRLFVSPNYSRSVSRINQHKTGFKKEFDERTKNNTPDTFPAVRDYLRQDLIDYLKQWPGFIGDPASGSPLLSQFPHNVKWEDVGSSWCINDALIDNTFKSYVPINNSYYRNSVLSIYVETITTSSHLENDQKVMSATEKTWNPLIKGHIILPFSSHGFISFLKDSYGIKFPGFIDYSYDEINNDLDRWFAYKTEVARVLNLGADFLYEQKKVNWEIIKHNKDTILSGRKYTVYEALQNMSAVDDDNKMYGNLKEKLFAINQLKKNK